MFDKENTDFPFLDNNCKSIVEKFLTVCLPVQVKPKVNIGKIKTESCGKPIVSTSKHEKCCQGMENGCCNFTIIQKMKIEIPIGFEAETNIDNLFVDCELKPNSTTPPIPECDNCEKKENF